MKHIFSALKLLIIVSLIIGLSSCSKTGSGRLGKGTKTFTSQEGWINGETYQMVVFGQWNRGAYYVEGEKPPKEDFGKLPKSSFGLREDSKTAAKVKAMRNFKEKMVSYISSVTKVENSALISDVVESSLRGVIIAPQSKSEEYSKQHDASITFHFQASELKAIVDGAVEETLKRFSEGSEALPDVVEKN